MTRMSRALPRVTSIVLGLVILLVGCGRVDFAYRRADGSLDPLDAATCAVEPFDTLPATLEIFGGGTVTATNGQLECTIPGTAGIDAAVRTIPNRSLVGTSMAIEIVQTAGDPEAAVGPGWHGTPAAVHLHIQQGTLRMWDDSGDLAMAPYDPLEHRWLRLRESGGTAYGEYSADGMVYVPFGTSTIVGLTDAHYDLGINPGGGLPDPDTAIFDHFTTCGP